MVVVLGTTDSSSMAGPKTDILHTVRSRLNAVLQRRQLESILHRLAGKLDADGLRIGLRAQDRVVARGLLDPEKKPPPFYTLYMDEDDDDDDDPAFSQTNRTRLLNGHARLMYTNQLSLRIHQEHAPGLGLFNGTAVVA